MLLRIRKTSNTWFSATCVAQGRPNNVLHSSSNANLSTWKKVGKNNDRTASVVALEHAHILADHVTRSIGYIAKKLVICLVASLATARKGSHKKAPRIESPPVKHPWTTSTPESCSLIFSWPPHVTRLTSRSNFSPALLQSASLSSELVPLLAVSV